MSRIGKQSIPLPKGTEVTVDDGSVAVKGPKGELSREVPREVSVSVQKEDVVVERTKDTQHARRMWGTFTSHLRNMITGVNEPYEKKLVVEGVGFKADVQGNKLVMQLGFSHPVELAISPDLEVKTEKELITVSGIDKEQVGHFAATIRSKKKPEPYKGKGIRYENEVIRRKQGKKAITAGA